MSGFVGSYAKKRRRNIFFTLIFILLISILIIIFPKFENNNNEIIPNGTIMPNPSEDLTSLISIIEELELSLFQKDQKIKFRDGQNKNLQNELKNVQSLYESLILKFNNISNDSDNKDLILSNKYKLLQEKFTKVNIQNDKNILKIKNLNKKTDDFNNNLLTNEEIKNIILDNKKLTKDAKIFFAKNVKLNNLIKDLKNNIIDMSDEVNLQLKEIKKLKDRSLHGG